MTLGKKLAACFFATVAISVVLGFSAWIYISRLKTEVEHLVHRTAKQVEIVSDVKNLVLTFRFAERGMLLFSSINNVEKVELTKSQFAKAIRDIGERLRELRPLLESEAERQAIQSVDESVNEYARNQAEIAAVAGSGKLREATQMDADRLVSIGGRIVKTIDDLSVGLKVSNQDAIARTDSLARNSRVVMCLLLTLSLALGAFAAKVVHASTRDLREISTQLGQGANQISSAAAQVASSSQSLAQGSSEQAASLQETSASSEEINSVTRQNAERAKMAADRMVEESQRIEDANRHLAQMVNSMEEINASSDKISKIIKVIDEIAFQTNILALNAAVEAARAGEAGMGFAVVADEVRNLAQRCAQAAQDTSGLIEESIGRANDGKTKLDLVATAVRSITESATQVKNLVDEVTLGSREQAHGVEQVTRAIQQMEKVTQTTAANAEESASASEELSAQSEALRSIAGRLNGMVGTSMQELTRPRFDRQSSRTLAKLAKSSSSKVVTPAHQRRAVAAGKDAFPLEDDFKEF